MQCWFCSTTMYLKKHLLEGGSSEVSLLSEILLCLLASMLKYGQIITTEHCYNEIICWPIENKIKVTKPMLCQVGIRKQ